MLESLKSFGFDRFPSLITNIEVLRWGNELKLECINDPHHRKIPYQLYFYDCQDIQFSVHSPENLDDIEADLIDFQINHKIAPKSAIIYTDIFEISVSYHQLDVGGIYRSPKSNFITKSL